MKRTLLRAVGIATILLACGMGQDHRVVADEKEDDIREIIEVTGTLKIAEQMLEPLLEQLTQLFAAVNPGQDARVRSLIIDEIRTVFVENITDLETLTMQAYAAHFTDSEIAELLVFYRSPLGQRLIEELPAIALETQAAGFQWGKALGGIAYDRVTDRLAAEGLNTQI